MRHSSARTKDGQPAYSRLASELGVSDYTLRRWWATAQGYESPEALTQATREASASEKGSGLRDSDPRGRRETAMDVLGIGDPGDWRVVRYVDTMEKRDQVTSDTAVAALTRELNRLAESLRVGEGEAGPLGPSELVAVMVGAPALVREALRELGWEWRE